MLRTRGVLDNDPESGFIAQSATNRRDFPKRRRCDLWTLILVAAIASVAVVSIGHHPATNDPSTAAAAAATSTIVPLPQHAAATEFPLERTSATPNIASGGGGGGGGGGSSPAAPEALVPAGEVTLSPSNSPTFAPTAAPAPPSPVPTEGVDGALGPKWDAPAFDAASTLLFFLHIPFTGGTAVSWHIVGSLANEEGGGVAPGSAASGRFEPRALVSGKGRVGEWDQKWLGGANATDGSGPIYKAAFGHNNPEDVAIQRYGGSLKFGTMLRKKQYDFKLQKPYVCNFLAKQYAPWWELGELNSAASTTAEKELEDVTYREAAKSLPPSPPLVRSFCSGQWRRKPPVRLSSSPQVLWLGRRPTTSNNNARPPTPATGSAAAEGRVPYANNPKAFNYSAEDAAVLDRLVLHRHAALADAAHALLRMPWFGIHDRWSASMCLLHHTTKWKWPHEHFTACGGQAIYSWNFSQYTQGPASSPEQSRQAKAAFAAYNASLRSRDLSSQKNIPRSHLPLGHHSHMGMSPGRQNRMACCPIRVAEKMLEHSSTRRVMAWLRKAFPDISNGISHAGEKRQPPPRRPYSEEYRGLFYGLDPSAHKDDKDATFMSWAGRVFRYRVKKAALELSEAGYSSENHPEHLSPDCFSPLGPFSVFSAKEN